MSSPAVTQVPLWCQVLTEGVHLAGGGCRGSYNGAIMRNLFTFHFILLLQENFPKTESL